VPHEIYRAIVNASGMVFFLLPKLVESIHIGVGRRDHGVRVGALARDRAAVFFQP
jgi:hypothetical protein